MGDSRAEGQVRKSELDVVFVELGQCSERFCGWF